MKRTFTTIILPKRKFQPTVQPVEATPAPRKPAPPKKLKYDPLAIAKEKVPGFDRDAMTYKGKPIHLTDIMRRTNRILKSQGKPQLSSSELWVVP